MVSMDKWKFAKLLLTMICVQVAHGMEVASPCSEYKRNKDEQRCLDAIRKKAEDPTVFWFGRAYAEACEGPKAHLADCYNRRRGQADSLVSRLFRKTELHPETLDRYLEVTYATQPGSYKACENEFRYDFTREVALDPLTRIVMTPFEVRAHPEVWWKEEEDSSSLYTLLFYDVGYLAVKALYVNIPGNNVTYGERVMQYEGPLNPTRNDNPYVFMLFRQPGVITLDDHWTSILSRRDWQAELMDFVEGHKLEGPLALSWVLVSGDPYSAEVKRTLGSMNTCSHFVSDAFQKHEVAFLPTTRAQEPYRLSVFINVTFVALSAYVNSCCTVHRYPAQTFNLNPLGDSFVLPAHTRGDITKYVTLHMATAFPDTQRDFENRTLTLLVVDPDVPLQAFGNPRLPFAHWLLINIRGGDVASGHVVLDYMGPAPPDAKPHRYYFLLFQQKRHLDPKKFDYSAANCSWDFRGRCRFDVRKMMEEKDLTLVGVTWMVARFDEFVRELYVGAGMNPRCAACHGVPGYADPCPSPVSAAVTLSVPPPWTLAILVGLFVALLR